MLNIAIIQGRLTKEPDMRSTQNGVLVANFTIANDDDFDRAHTDFIDCTAWRQTAEFVEKYFHKGMLVTVQGRMRSRKWTTREGDKRISWEVQCDRVHFSESKKNTENRQSDDYAYRGQYENQPAPQPQQFEELDDEGELPF